jgi:hypothetical protein
MANGFQFSIGVQLIVTIVTEDAAIQRWLQSLRRLLQSRAAGKLEKWVTLKWKAFPGFSIADHQHRWRSMRQVTARRRSEIDDVASLLDRRWGAWRADRT